MKDRYLYRAKRKDNGEWVEGYLFDDGFENGRMFVVGLVIEEYKGTACDDWSINGIDFYEVDPSTICQCTGLKDKNCKLIFESDIVDCHDKRGVSFYHCRVRWNNIKARFDVWTMGCSFPMTLDACVDDISIPGFDYEVIGNVFDNPELLEVGE